MVDLLLPILVALVPVIIAVIGARLYGVLHGVITYLFMGQLLMFCLSMFGANIGAELAASAEEHSVLHAKVHDFVVAALEQFGLGDILADEAVGGYVILGAFFVLFLISQIIGGSIRKKSVEKTKILKRQVRRY